MTGEEHAGPDDAAQGAHEGADGHGADPLVATVTSIDFIAACVNFALLLVVLYLVLRRPLASFLRTRRIAVVEGIEEAAKLRAEAEAQKKLYADRLARLQDEMTSLRAEMVRSGEAERDRLVAEAEAKAARMRKDAEFLIEQQMKQLRIDLTREAVEAAVKAAEDVLRRAVSETDQQRLAKDYLERLRASAPRPAAGASPARPPVTTEPSP